MRRGLPDVVERVGLEQLPNRDREQRPEVVQARVSHPQKPKQRDGMAARPSNSREGEAPVSPRGYLSCEPNG